MEQTKISIVTPLYNAAPYILDTLRMVQQQTYTIWEWILVDDASTDDSVQLVQDYLEQTPDNRIRLICKKQNEGAAAARNIGIDAATGEIIAFLDADDIWLPQKLEKELAFMEEQDAAFVFCSYEFGDEQANGTGRIVHAPATLTYRQALSRTVIFTTTVMFDMRKLKKEDIYMPLIKSEDTATWWKVLRTGCIAHGMDEVLAIYRRPKKSLSSNKWEAIKRIWYLYRVQEKLGVLQSAWYFIFWAYRATMRRL